LMSQTGAF